VLDADILALPTDDPHNVHLKLAWLSVDRASSVWVTSCPSGANRAGPESFREIACRFMGLTSPCARALSGQTIWSAGGEVRGICDAYGAVLTSSTLSGDGWRTAHDAIKNAIAAVCVAFSIEYTCEVFGLFSSCIAAGPRREVWLADKQVRHPGMVPDIRVDGLNEQLGGGGAPVPGTQRVGELKLIRNCPTWYNKESDERQGAVKKRASLINGEYLKKAQKIDVMYGNTPEGEFGPCCDRLRSFGAVLALVVGHYSEWSPDVEKLVAAMATVAVPRVGHLYSSLSAERAKQALVNKARREISWAGLNANAKLLLDRAEWVGPTFVAAKRNAEALKFLAAQRRKTMRGAYNDEYAQAAVRHCFTVRERAYFSGVVGG
jgi:hypothetical protein